MALERRISHQKMLKRPLRIARRRSRTSPRRHARSLTTVKLRRRDTSTRCAKRKKPQVTKIKFSSTSTTATSASHASESSFPPPHWSSIARPRSFMTVNGAVDANTCSSRQPTYPNINNPLRSIISARTVGQTNGPNPIFRITTKLIIIVARAVTTSIMT